MQSSTWYFCPLLSASNCTALTASQRLTCWSRLRSKSHSQMPDSPHSPSPRLSVRWFSPACCCLAWCLGKTRSRKERETHSCSPVLRTWGIDSGFTCSVCTYVCACVHVHICACICVCIGIYIPFLYIRFFKLSHQLVQLCLVSWIWMSQIYLEN